jgi:hypothetical protein
MQSSPLAPAAEVTLTLALKACVLWALLGVLHDSDDKGAHTCHCHVKHVQAVP